MVYKAKTDLHLSVLELMRMTPGLYADLVQIWTEQNVPAKPEDNFDD